MLDTPEGRREARRYFQDKYDSESLANKYMRMIVSSERDRLMDYTYCVRHENGKWMIGDSPFEIETNDRILINGKRYKGTPGPVSYTHLDVYKRQGLVYDKKITD